MTELVREAVHEYQVRQESIGQPDLAVALERSSGLWCKGDGLAWQEKLRQAAMASEPRLVTRNTRDFKPVGNPDVLIPYTI